MSELSERIAQLSAAALAIADPSWEQRIAEPAVGDVWRARWSDHACLVYVTRAAEPLQVVPVSLGSEADDSAVVASAAATGLGASVTLWTGDEVRIPTRSLDFRITHLAPSTTGEYSYGSKNWGATDPRTRLRAGLVDDVEALREATWLPATAGTGEIATLVANADMADVIEALGSLKTAQRIRRGGAITPEQAVALSLVVNRTADELLAANPALPEDLVFTMDRPAVRARVAKLADQRRISEPEAWRQAAYGTLGLAAREHDRGVISWPGRVNAYLNTVLEEEN